MNNRKMFGENIKYFKVRKKFKAHRSKGKS